VQQEVLTNEIFLRSMMEKKFVVAAEEKYFHDNTMMEYHPVYNLNAAS